MFPPRLIPPTQFGGSEFLCYHTGMEFPANLLARRRVNVEKLIGARLSNVDIALFALCSLGGVQRRIHLEEVANECHRLAPGRFGWELKQFKQIPDIRVAADALADARKEKSGGLVRSVGARGRGGMRFQLTTCGVKWLEENKARIAKGLKSKSAIAPLAQVRRVLEFVENDHAFRKFVKNGGVSELSIYDFADFLGCTYEPSLPHIRRKFIEMKKQAELVEYGKLTEFLRACESAPQFARIINARGIA